MKKFTWVLALCFSLFAKNIYSQIPGGILVPGDINLNGMLDALDEFSTTYTVPIEMPDGIKLMTDITIPITQDCMTVVIPSNIPIIGGEVIELIPRGLQLFIYDSINGQPNPNPYSLPIVFTRTPYNKQGDVAGKIVSIFGYAYALQDMRGRYSSEGVYFPMMSDSWNKNPYHNHFKHILDHTDMQDPKNGNKHEDGYHSVEYLANTLLRTYDIDNDGVLDTFLLNNGSIGMFGASALGNTQYQAAAAHKINPNGRGLKSLLPIVATNEHFKYTGYQNGVFRERIVTGWLKGQIFSGVDDDLIPIDNDPQNNIHTSADYDLPKTLTINGRTKTFQPNQFDASTLAIDHFVRMRYEGGVPGYYPNSAGRADMDASFAPVNEFGESIDPNDLFTPLPNLNYSRYRNKDVAAYHLTGWWDIFTDGQIETWRLMREHAGPVNNKLQKLVIGPWAHQTIGSTQTGDMQYKENVADLIGFDLGNVDLDELEVENLLKSEIVSWFRYTLNYNNYANIGVPKVLLPESRKWQNLAGGTIKVRVPSEDYKITFIELINFINGTGDLKGLKLDIDVFGIISSQTIDIPPLGEPIIPELSGDQIGAAIDSINFVNVPDVRFYVIGPVDDGIAENNTAGNYWFGADTFPLVNDISWQKMYMHQGGKLNEYAPDQDEGYTIYVHDPDDQVYSIGGANMIVRLPDGHQSTVVRNGNSHGQINLADTRWKHRTMDRHGVVSFETELLKDTVSVIGFPVVTLYAKSNPGGAVDGPTDTDFFVRVLDVYPDGRQFFVVEGCVNARARDYARYMAENDGHEDPNLPFTNINIGEIYEYVFRIMPIAYTWGKGHKIKILISSSNHTRYQVNPNLPIADGDFFRRQPLDGQKYIFNGEEMAPRVAVQRVAHSPEYPTSISFPIYNKNYIGISEVQPGASDDLNITLYPNPASEQINIYMNIKQEYQLTLYNTIGQEALRTNFRDQVTLDASKFDKGIYVVEVRNAKSGKTITSKVTIQ